MNILQICNKSPYPPNEGGSIAMYNLGQGLIEAGHGLTVLAMDTFKNPVNLKNIPKKYYDQTSFETAPVDLRVKLLPALFALLSFRSYHARRFKSRKFRNKLREILHKQSFDIIQLETVFPGVYISDIRKFSDAKIIIRSHNIEHLIWQRIAKQCPNVLKKAYLKYLAKTLKNFEISTLNKCDGVACISRKDAHYLLEKKCMASIAEIGFGIDLESYRLCKSNFNTAGFFHIGSMNWIPNLEGIRWLLKEVWQHQELKETNRNLFLAGRHMPEELSKANIPGLQVLGEVESATEFISKHDIMLVPLFSGSGIRVKIIESMAMGKVVISTAIGAEGIQYADGENMLIANTASAFIQKINFCLNNPEICAKIAGNGRKYIEREHDIRKLTKKLLGFYRHILNN